jgi:hypothetical protein
MKEHLLNVVTNNQPQYIVFGVLSLVILGLTATLSLSQVTFAQPYKGSIRVNPAGFFQPFFGNIHPLLAVAVIAVIGVVSLGFLQSRGWFEIFTMRGTLQGMAVSAIIATLFGIEVVIAETANIFRLPADMNVPLHWSLIFYPVIGYVVEIIFHALPLALFLAVLGPFFEKLNIPGLIWLCILVVSLLEPIFQVGSGQPLSFAQAYIGLHVFAINILQLYVFRHYDFVSMYSFRLFYYMYWHIIWGYLRLQWLF